MTGTIKSRFIGVNIRQSAEKKKGGQGAVRGEDVHRRGVEKIASVRSAVRVADQFRTIKGVIVGQEGQVVGIP